MALYPTQLWELIKNPSKLLWFALYRRSYFLALSLSHASSFSPPNGLCENSAPCVWFCVCLRVCVCTQFTIRPYWQAAHRRSHPSTPLHHRTSKHHVSRTHTHSHIQNPACTDHGRRTNGPPVRPLSTGTGASETTAPLDGRSELINHSCERLLKKMDVCASETVPACMWGLKRTSNCGRSHISCFVPRGRIFQFVRKPEHPRRTTHTHTYMQANHTPSVSRMCDELYFISIYQVCWCSCCCCGCWYRTTSSECVEWNGSAERDPSEESEYDCMCVCVCCVPECVSRSQFMCEFLDEPLPTPLLPSGMMNDKRSQHAHTHINLGTRDTLWRWTGTVVDY